MAIAQPSIASSTGASEMGKSKRKFDLDTDTLECPICTEPLSTPVFQCRNGHCACSSCCKKINNGCPSCAQPIGVRRNFAIEKVIESLQVSCKHAPRGCNIKLKYMKREAIEEHENNLCEYRPLQCPFKFPATCLHTGSEDTILSHLVSEHGIQVVECPGSASFTMKASCPMTVLKSDAAWLLVNCWKARYNFGSYLFCSALGGANHEAGVLHKLSLDAARLRDEEKIYLTFTCVQAAAQNHSDLDLEKFTLEDILVGAYLNVPHDDADWSELEFDLQVTLL